MARWSTCGRRLAGGPASGGRGCGLIEVRRCSTASCPRCARCVRATGLPALAAVWFGLRWAVVGRLVSEPKHWERLVGALSCEIACALDADCGWGSAVERIPRGQCLLYRPERWHQTRPDVDRYGLRVRGQRHARGPRRPGPQGAAGNGDHQRRHQHRSARAAKASEAGATRISAAARSAPIRSNHGRGDGFGEVIQRHQGLRLHRCGSWR
jgi:hypothetical protein